MTTTVNGLEAHGVVNFESAEGGNSIAFDLGLASEVNHNWTFSLVVKNILGSMQWSEDALEKNYYFLINPITLDIIEDTDSDSLFKTEQEEKSLSTIVASLPVELHFGSSYDASDLSLTMDYIQGLNKNPGCSTSPQFACGLQLMVLHWLKLRTGVAIGGDEQFKSAAGFGIQYAPFTFDLGISNCGGMFLDNQRGLNLAIGFGFWF